MRFALPASALLATSLLTAPARAAPPSPAGLWRNASDSVRIRVAPCGDALCGTVVQASDKAKADAAAGGTERLVGTPLFRDLRADADGVWRGEVFVPDLGRAVEGTLERTGPDTLVATGCLFAGLGCRAQTWVRVGPRGR